jgi:hypothetical protein
MFVLFFTKVGLLNTFLWFFTFSFLNPVLKKDVGLIDSQVIGQQNILNLE